MNSPVEGLWSAMFLMLENNYRITGMEVGGGTGGEAVARQDSGFFSTVLNRSGWIWRCWTIVDGKSSISPLYILYHSAKVSSLLSHYDIICTEKQQFP